MASWCPSGQEFYGRACSLCPGAPSLNCRTGDPAHGRSGLGGGHSLAEHQRRRHMVHHHDCQSSVNKPYSLLIKGAPRKGWTGNL
eukprot:1158527-Pelagomonas_calceolata.AAC.6